MKKIKFEELELNLVDGSTSLEVSVSNKDNLNERLTTYLNKEDVIDLSKSLQKIASKMTE